MEKTKITGFSVDEQLITGQEFYGEIGTLIGVVEYGKEGQYWAIFEDNNGNIFYKDAVIDTMVDMSRKGPDVSEIIYAGETNHPIRNEVAERIKAGLKKYGNLDFVCNGEVNVELALSQYDNTIFIGDDNLIEQLRQLKQSHPGIPLIVAIKLERPKALDVETIAVFEEPTNSDEIKENTIDDTIRPIELESLPVHEESITPEDEETELPYKKFSPEEKRQLLKDLLEQAASYTEEDPIENPPYKR